MILTLKIKLLFGLYSKDDWEGTFEVDESTLLIDLHDAINRALRFDDDHMFEFYVARTPRSSDRVHYDDENGRLYDTKIGNLYPLPTDRNLYYLFDYGDSWLFKVSKSRQQPRKPKLRVKYPRLIHTEGKRPEQYPEPGE
jgi:hypothetical protein